MTPSAGRVLLDQRGVAIMGGRRSTETRTPMTVLVLDDGSALLINQAPTAPLDDQPADDGTLSTLQEVQGFLVDAVAAGITFDVLKAMVVSLAQRGHLAPRRLVGASDVRAALESYFRGAGYLDVRINELRKINDEGWLARGVVDTAPFQALADVDAQVVHVRVQ